MILSFQKPRGFNPRGFFYFSLLATSLLSATPAFSQARDLDILRRQQADLSNTVNELRAEFQALNGNQDANKHFIDLNREETAKMLRDFDDRVTAVEERFQILSAQMDEILARLPEGTGKAQAEAALYNRALTEMNLKNVKNAQALFSEFLKKFPKSPLAPNAQYWIAEGFYAQKDYQTAVLEFQKVVAQYPRSDKVPGAILKQGYAFAEMQSWPEAKAFLEKVVSDYPKSEEAGLAKIKLKKLSAEMQLQKQAAKPATAQ